MTDYLSTLPVELLHIIFDDLSVGDILASMCFANQRLRTVCRTYPRFRFDFNSSAKKKTQFQSVCAHLPHVSSRILSLTFSKEYNSLVSFKIGCFFSRFLQINDGFSKLHSITIDPIDEQTWRSINRRLTTLPSLVSLSIRCGEHLELSIASQLLRELLLDSLKLKRLHVKLFVNSSDAFIVDPCPSTRRSQIEHLHLEGIRLEFQSLFSVTPALQSLDANLKLFQFRPNTRFHSPETIRQLTISVNFIGLEEIKTMLHSLRQLTDLTVISKNVQYDMADGWTWNRLLKSILIFKFIFTFDQNTFTSPAIDLTSFRSSFWLEKKHWYVTYERSLDTGFALLYSNPYCREEHPLLFMRDRILLESTSSQATVLPHPTSLTADSPYPIEVTAALRSSSPQIARESLADCGTSLRSKLDYAMEHLHLSQITSFTASRCETDLSTDIFVQFLQRLPRLRSLDLSVCLLKRLLNSDWSNILSLHVSANKSGESDPLILWEADAFCRSFPHLDRLLISTDVLTDLSLLLNNVEKMPILSQILFFPFNRVCGGDNQQIIEREWLETNTQLRHFHYFRSKQGIVNLWL